MKITVPAILLVIKEEQGMTIALGEDIRPRCPFCGHEGSEIHPLIFNESKEAVTCTNCLDLLDFLEKNPKGMVE